MGDKVVIYENGQTYEVDKEVIYNPFPEERKDEDKNDEKISK